MKDVNKEFLDKYKTEMETAYFCDYSRQLPRTVLQEMDRIFTEETQKDLKTNYSCGHCVIKLIKSCARIYYKDYPDEIPEDKKDKKI